MEFHEKLQELRKRRGLTQEEPAELTVICFPHGNLQMGIRQRIPEH